LDLAKPIKDMGFQLEFNSLVHLVQKLTSYEQRHPEIYQDKFKCEITLIDTKDAEDSGEEQEVAVVEWTRGGGANLVSCNWVKQQGPTNGFDFDESKVEQIFDLLLREKQLKLPEDHKFPTTQELQGRPYCKWHHLFTHTTNDCKELRRQIQSAIEQGQLILGQFTMKVDTWSFPSINMVESHRDAGEQSVWHRLDFTFDINMAGPPRHRDEKEGAIPAIGPEKAKENTSLKSRWGTCGINGHSPCICSRNMNTSIGSVASVNQKTKNMNTVLGRVWRDVRMRAIIGIALSSSTAGILGWADCLPSIIARSADLESMMQKGSRCFSA
jgi:hypothetical protein